MENRQPIGVFDSGLGGLTVVRQLAAVLPREDLVYFGDTARVPYGTRTDDTILKYSRQDAAFLLSRGIKLMIAACGTSSSVAGATLKSEVPVPFFEMVGETARVAAAHAPRKKIGLLATPATVRSHSHREHLKRIDPAITLTEQACPLFVPIIENGYFRPTDEIAVCAAKLYLQPFQADPPDVLILGCTHYPLLSEVIASLLPGVLLLDPGRAVAEQVRRELTAVGGLNPTGGKQEFFVSDSPDEFARFAAAALGHNIRCADPVDIDSF